MELSPSPNAWFKVRGEMIAKKEKKSESVIIKRENRFSLGKKIQMGELSVHKIKSHNGDFC